MKKQTTGSAKGILPKVARRIGESTVKSRCLWWYNQPKIPAKMKEDK